MSRTLPVLLLITLLPAARARAQAPASQPADADAEAAQAPASQTSPAGDLAQAPFTEAQRRFLRQWGEAFKAKVLQQAREQAQPPRASLKLNADTYTKILYQNDQSQGSVTYGTPHPRGDNFSGNNGFASEFSLHVEGQVSEMVQAGARLKSRFHRQWADFYENGDLAVDSSGLPAGADATGESLGMNHAGYIQLRGVFLHLSPPTPYVKGLHVGSSDLGMFNAWTIGRVRFIDRDNANGLFLDGALWSLSYTLARVTLPKLYASAGWNSGIDDPVVQNPFWTRDAAYALKLEQQPADWLSWTLVTSYLLDEEADLNDPDSLGSTNLYDTKDGVVATLPRYQNVNSTLELGLAKRSVDANLLAAFSYSAPDLDYVFNSVDGNQGVSPIPMKEALGYAVKARVDLVDPFGVGLDIHLEYFNIGADWVATFGARREQDVLLTDGFLDGQLPTINLANEFIDFRDPFYESIVGWHGATIVPALRRGAFDAKAEFTFLEYNTDMQDRCVGSTMANEAGNPIASVACPRRPASSGSSIERPYGVYPTFLYSDGMTDTDFFSYANTTDRGPYSDDCRQADRGRDPRSVYRQNQARRTLIGVLQAGHRFDVGRGLRWEVKLKYILDTDQRDQDVLEDDYRGHLIFARTRLTAPLTERLEASLGAKLDWWDEAHRSGAIVGGQADYPDYRTLKANTFIDLNYKLGGAVLSGYLEYLNKDMKVSREGVEDPTKSRTWSHVVRAIGSVWAPF